MNKMFALLAAVSAVAFAAPSFAAEKTSSESYHTATDAAGTTTTDKTKTETKVSENGDSKTVEKTKHSVDPKGLMNKHTTTTKTTDTVKGGVAEHKKEVNGKTVEDTKAAAPSAGE